MARVTQDVSLWDLAALPAAGLAKSWEPAFCASECHWAGTNGTGAGGCGKEEEMQVKVKNPERGMVAEAWEQL